MKKKIHYGYWIMIIGVLTILGSLGFARFAYTMILPEMSNKLGFSNTQMGAIATANFIGYLFFSVVGGALAAKYAPRAVIGLSMLTTGVSMLLTGLVTNFYAVLALRAITGLGSGGSYVPTLGLVSAWFGKSRRGMAAGFILGGGGLGMLLSGVGVPAIISAFGHQGWRYSWFILGLGVILLGLVGFLVNRDHPSEKRLIPIGDAGQAGHVPAPGGTVSLKAVYNNPTLWHLGLIYMLWGFSYIIFMTFFTAYLVKENHLQPSAAGSLFALNGILAIFSSFIWGTVSDKIGRKLAMTIVYFLQAIAFMIYAFSSSYSGFLTVAILYGLTSFSIPSIVAAACGDYAAPGLAPAALGFVNIFFGIGQIIGPSLGGYLTDLTGTYSVAFGLAGIMAFAGGIGSFFLKVKVDEIPVSPKADSIPS